MNLKELLTRAPNLTPDQAREFMDSHREGSYTLLDVRQPVEYGEGHIPGARLVPLPELPGRLGELDAEKPMVVYCAVGGRSRAAAQLLQAQGFKEVHNMSGGFKAWQGAAAQGPPNISLDLGSPGDGPAEVLILAMAMESGLREAYLTLAGRSAHPETGALLKNLASIEDRHLARVREIYDRLDLEDRSGKPLEPPQGPARMEGGGALEELLDLYREGLSGPRPALGLAMALEGQALDLYLRLGRYVENPEARAVLLEIGDEEKAHLASLSRLMDETRPG